MADIYETLLLFFNLQILFFYHKLSFSEQGPIINMSSTVILPSSPMSSEVRGRHRSTVLSQHKSTIVDTLGITETKSGKNSVQSHEKGLKDSNIVEHVPVTEAMRFLSQEEYESHANTFISNHSKKSDLRVIDQDSVQTMINKLNRFELVFNSLLHSTEKTNRESDNMKADKEKNSPYSPYRTESSIVSKSPLLLNKRSTGILLKNKSSTNML